MNTFEETSNEILKNIKIHVEKQKKDIIKSFDEEHYNKLIKRKKKLIKRMSETIE